jgi:hypothetical protein
MNSMAVSTVFVVVLLGGVVLIAELRAYWGSRRLRGRGGEVRSSSSIAPVDGTVSVGLSFDTNHGYGGSCGIVSFGDGGGCDGSGHHG